MDKIEIQPLLFAHSVTSKVPQPVFVNYAQTSVSPIYQIEYSQPRRATTQVMIPQNNFGAPLRTGSTRQFWKQAELENCRSQQHVFQSASRREPVHQMQTPQLISSTNKIIAESPLKFNTSVKSKLFKQISNKQNQAEDSAASKYKYISKTSIKKEATPLKIEFQSQSARKRPTIAPFKLPQIENTLLEEQVSTDFKNNETSLEASDNITLNDQTKNNQIESETQKVKDTTIAIPVSQNNPQPAEFILQFSNETEELLAKYSKECKPYLQDFSCQSIRPSFSLDEEWKQRSSFSLLNYTVTDILDFKSPRKSVDCFSQSFYIPETIKSPTAIPVYPLGSIQQQVQLFWDTNSSVIEENQTTQKSQPQVISYPKLDDFIKGKRLGKGMFGQVFIVQHKSTGFMCAMKILCKQFIRTQKVSEQLIQQLKIHMFMNHPNIVNVYGFFSDEDNVYILQQLCTGGQLFDILVKRRRISQKRTAYYVKQMLEGLNYIHQKQVVHRDIKPQNILLQFGVVKIGDFGWAAYSPDNQYAEKCGTPLYYSPEVIRGQKYTRTADNWGVGLICFELIVGNIPWSIWTEQEISRIAEEDLVFPNFMEVSNKAQDFIERVLTKYPNNRLTIDEMNAHNFLSQTNIYDYHNQKRDNYGQATP